MGQILAHKIYRCVSRRVHERDSEAHWRFRHRSVRFFILLPNVHW
jgi:hypothetical protein